LFASRILSADVLPDESAGLDDPPRFGDGPEDTHPTMMGVIEVVA
jgi:hypothetical protein